MVAEAMKLDRKLLKKVVGTMLILALGILVFGYGPMKSVFHHSSIPRVLCASGFFLTLGLNIVFIWTDYESKNYFVNTVFVWSGYFFIAFYS